MQPQYLHGIHKCIKIKGITFIKRPYTWVPLSSNPQSTNSRKKCFYLTPDITQCNLPKHLRSIINIFCRFAPITLVSFMFIVLHIKYRTICIGQLYNNKGMIPLCLKINTTTM